MRDELRGSKESGLPEPVIRRLPRYLIDAQELQASGEKWVSSVALAKALGLTSSTVRQDLSHLELEGVSKRGYEVAKLVSAVSRKLGADKKYRVAIVGAGLLGSAIVLHGELVRYGFEVTAVTDINPEIIGTWVGGLQVQPMSAVQRLAQEGQVDIGILAVPAADAQSVAEQLIAVGVTALLNLALVQLKVPEHVQVVDERIVVSLQELAYLMRVRAADERSTERREP